MENYQHHITKHIKRFCLHKIFSPLIYLLILVLLWMFLPLSDILMPIHLDDVSHIPDLYHDNSIYIERDFTDLHFTGYTKTFLGRNTGYFYYTNDPDNITFLLLSPNTCEEGLPVIDSVHVEGIIEHNTPLFRNMLTGLSSDLNWTYTGLLTSVSSYYINEPSFHSYGTVLLLIFYFASGAYALFMLLSNLIYFFFPVLAPPIRKLGMFGKASQLFALAEEELATLPQLATEDMFITEHFFIETSKYGIAVVPIQEICWIYKYSTLHKLFWYHFNISYTLHITANRHLHIHCPKNIQSDIDGIIDYLSEANHNILVGFSEENRLKVQQTHDVRPPFFIERLVLWINKKKRLP